MSKAMDEYIEEYMKDSEIRGCIKACKSLGQSMNETEKKIMELFGLSHVDAAQKVSEFWESGSTDQTN